MPLTLRAIVNVHEFVQLFEMSNLVYTHPGKLLLPAIEGLFRNPRLATDLADRCPRLGLAQHKPNLLIRVPLPFHGKIPSSLQANFATTITSMLDQFSGRRPFGHFLTFDVGLDWMKVSRALPAVP